MKETVGFLELGMRWKLPSKSYHIKMRRSHHSRRWQYTISSYFCISRNLSNLSTILYLEYTLKDYKKEVKQTTKVKLFYYLKSACINPLFIIGMLFIRIQQSNQVYSLVRIWVGRNELSHCYDFTYRGSGNIAKQWETRQKPYVHKKNNNSFLVYLKAAFKE